MKNGIIKVAVKKKKDAEINKAPNPLGILCKNNSVLPRKARRKLKVIRKLIPTKHHPVIRIAKTAHNKASIVGRITIEPNNK